MDKMISSGQLTAQIRAELRSDTSAKETSVEILLQNKEDAFMSVSKNVVPQEERYQRPIYLTCDEKNYHALLVQSTIQPGMNIQESKASLERVELEGKNTKMITSGGITVVAAKPKEGKTKLTYTIATAALHNGMYRELLKSFVDAKQSDVGLVDTEQSIEECNDGYRIVQTLLGVHAVIDKLRMLSLRRFTYKERIFLLEKWVYDNACLGYLIIDGIRDFVSDPNSAEEANMVISKLMKWSMELNLSIVVVLHLNKINDHLRGHLGSEILNKCSNAITVEKRDNVFVVRSLVSRGKEFSPFAFELDETGVPIIIQNYAIQNKKSASKEILTPESIELDMHKHALKTAFTSLNIDLVRWKALSDALRVAFASVSINIGENKMRLFISYYRHTVGLIVLVPTPGNQYGAYRLAI